MSLVSTQWFLLAFVNALPAETTLRVWDVFLTVGPTALFAAALATISLLAPPILGEHRASRLIPRSRHRPRL